MSRQLRALLGRPAIRPAPQTAHPDLPPAHRRSQRLPSHPAPMAWTLWAAVPPPSRSQAATYRSAPSGRRPVWSESPPLPPRRLGLFPLPLQPRPATPRARRTPSAQRPRADTAPKNCIRRLTIGKAGAELGLMLGAFRRHPRPALLVCLIALCGVLTLWLSCCCCCCCVLPCPGADLSAENRAYHGVGARYKLGQYEA